MTTRSARTTRTSSHRAPNPARARRAAPAGARHVARLAIAACTAVALLALAAAAAPGGLISEAGALGKGIVDNRLETTRVDSALVPIWAQEMGRGSDGLGAKWTRILVRWSALQPTSASTRDADYVAQLDTVVDQLRGQDIKIIMTLVDVPRWASNSALWKSPPKGYKRGVYQPFYAMAVRKTSVRRAFANLGQYLASHFVGRVKHFECWNEPNLGSCLYPQRTRSDANYGARTYLTMLRAFNTGVNRAVKSDVVIAGATAPRGGGDAYSTTPQAFARFLKKNKVTRSCDAYSHHPYVPRGSRSIAPSAKPNNPNTAVTLGNLSALTSLFPRLPFYLTEYGYGTHDSRYFGCTVSESKQARYLTQAYALTARKKQVKVLLWFLVKDWSEKGTTTYDTYGAYTGLVDLKDNHKPAWKAFQRVK